MRVRSSMVCSVSVSLVEGEVFFVIPFFFVVCAGVARDDMAFVVRHPEPGINAPVMRRSHLLMLDRVPR